MQDIFGNALPVPSKPILSAKQEKEARIKRHQDAIDAKEAKRNKMKLKVDDDLGSSVTQIATIERTASFRNKGLVVVDIYRREDNAPFNPKAKENLIQNKDESCYNGYLSPATRRLVERTMSVWLTSVELKENMKLKKKEVNAAKVFPTFVTLTLPGTQMHSDNQIKATCLNPFITWLQGSSEEVYKNGPKKGQKKGFGVGVYFWRAEPQKTGRIHFHIICDKYVPWDAIRDKWNQCVERLGYVTRYGYVQKGRFKNGFIVDQDRLEAQVADYKQIVAHVLETGEIPDKINPVLEKYLSIAIPNKMQLSDAMLEQAAKAAQKESYEKAKNCDFTNPPSTEIRAIRNLNSVAAYVIKYVAKKPTEKALEPNQEVKPDVYGVNQLYTYTYKEQPDGTQEQIIESREVYKPTFEERKINGRIWGCSDSLRGYIPRETDIIEKDDLGRTYITGTISKEIQNGHEVAVITPLEHKKPVPVMKYFSKVLEVKEVFLTQSGNDTKVYVSPAMNVDNTSYSYINKMISYVGEKEIERISNEVGESFAKMQGMIIPFRTEKMGYAKVKDKKGKLQPMVVKHATILANHSPELHRQYTAYYNHVYDCIYTKTN